MGFYINSKSGKVIEGFMSDDFSGELILLREPNIGEELEPSYFWLKDDKPTRFIKCFAKLTNSDSAYPKYAYANIFNCLKENGKMVSKGNTTSVSKAYIGLTNDEKASRALCKIKACECLKKNLTVYTCADIYKSLLGHFKKSNPTIEEHTGKEYTRGNKTITLKFFEVENLRVYEIFHPSYPAKLK